VSRSAVSLPVLRATGTIRVADAELPEATIDLIRERWAALEHRFDPSLPNSEFSQIASGRGYVQQASSEFRAAHADAIRWRNDTGGYFRAHRPDGVLDLDALVRAYALRNAATELTRAGLESWLVELGGDVMCDALGGGGWTARIADPADQTRLLATVPLGGSWTSVATSRAGEREEDPAFVQATALGRDVVAVEALAKAVVAGGDPAFELATTRWPVDVLAVDPAGGLRPTSRLERHVRPSAEGSIPASGAR
jgi:thiamine biosynthesis lipoprotein ApbE